MKPEQVAGQTEIRTMLQDAIRRTLMISEQVGIRALLTHPIDDRASKFYERFGFVSSPVREKQLVLLLKDARQQSSQVEPLIA